MISVSHSSMKCPHFTSEGVELDRTVIIGPIRIFEDIQQSGQKVCDLVIGCNMYRNCENTDCGYSWVSRQERKNRYIPAQ